MVAVSYVAVPLVARVINAVDDYNPIYYEPKDFARQEHLERQAAPATQGLLTLETLFKIGLMVAVVVVWRLVVPGGGADRSSIRR